MTKTILVIEDTEDNRQILRDLLGMSTRELNRLKSKDII